MSAAPLSTTQQARQALGDRLRQIRRVSGLRAAYVADQAGWAPSKVSRLENGVTVPTGADLRTWCRICGADDEADDLIAAAVAVDSLYVEWRRQVKAGMVQVQQSTVPLYERTETFRVYCSNVVPGYLQTQAYAAEVLASFRRFRGLARDDVADAAAARWERSQIVHRPGHRFAVVVEESVLRYRFGTAAVMAGQLEYLLRAMTFPQVSLGVIPLDRSRDTLWNSEPFVVFDEALVRIELLTAEVNISSRSEIGEYIRAFAELSALAVHGASARGLITDAIAALEAHPQG